MTGGPPPPEKKQRRSARRDPEAMAAREAVRAATCAAKERRAVSAALRVEARRLLRRGEEVEFDRRSGRARRGPVGLGRWAVAPADVARLRGLHERIKAGCAAMMGWAGGSDARDERRRCFGLVAGGREALESSGIALHSFETRRRDHEREMAQNWASCVDVTPTEDEARSIAAVAEAAALAVDPRFRDDLTLIALQPNVHGGAEFLPRHLDWPRNDGFGVVIVTLALVADATVVLQNADGRDFYFHLPEGHAYLLSADARNTCTHGLFCLGRGDRESLNFRFALHDQARARDEIYRHWADIDPASCGPDGPIYPD